jgi:phage-related protein
MLKVESIEFRDKTGKTYTIHKSRIENFPLTGGEESRLISTQVWNQHGTTPVSSFMNEVEGELVFIIRTSNKTASQISELRREITDVCNPLNGTIEMTVNLNNSESYKREITFTSTPIFPTGFENRNSEWQRVQLLFIANNPFWYSQEEILETFQGVEPLFQFPFEMSETKPVVFGSIIPNNTAYNSGQVEAPVIIQIKGKCVNPKITNVTTGEFISFRDLTMNKNDVLIIDTTFGQKKVELNGINVFNKLDFSSTFFNLQRGENFIDFTDETGTDETTIQFIYKNLYVTI